VTAAGLAAVIVRAAGIGVHHRTVQCPGVARVQVPQEEANQEDAAAQGLAPDRSKKEKKALIWSISEPTPQEHSLIRSKKKLISKQTSCINKVLSHKRIDCAKKDFFISLI